MPIQLTKTYKTIIKYILIGVAVVLVLGALGSFLLGKRLEQKLYDFEGLTYKNLELDILERTFLLEDIGYQIAETTEDTTQVYCGTARIEGIKWLPLLWRKDLRIQKLYVDSLIGVVYREAASDSTSNVANSQLIRSFSVQDVVFENINLEYNRRREWQVKTEELKLHLEELRYEKEEFNFRHFTLSATNTEWIPHDGNYAWSCKQYDADTRKGTAKVTDVKMRPMYSKTDWSAQYPYRKARIEWTITEAKASGLKAEDWFEHRQLYVEDVVLNEAKMDVWIDKSVEDCTDCYNAFFHERLLESELPLTINRLQCKNHNLSLDVVQADADKHTSISFQNIYASLYHISNANEHIAQHPSATADIETFFNGDAKLKAHLEFALNDKDFGYSYKASLDELDLTKVNELFEGDAAISVTSGLLKKLNFEASGNQQLAEGTMNFNYEDLHIQLLDEEQKPKKVLSFLTNNLLLNSNNTTEKNGYKSGSMYYERVRHKSLFHQYWGAIKSGIRSTLMPNLLLPDELENEKIKSDQSFK